jgi:hypothetical protein
MFALTTASLAQAAAVPFIEASGSGLHWWRICSTCPDEIVRLNQRDGGPLRDSAAVAGTEDGFAFAAAASNTGPNQLPVLKVVAETTVPAAPAIYTQATANTHSLQAYTYGGSEAGSYTIEFSVDGLITGDSESIYAGLTVYNSRYDPQLEGGGFDSYLASAAVSVSPGTPGIVTVLPFAETRSVSFEVAAGEVFYVSAYLSANAFYGGLGGSGSPPGSADAFHSFGARFVAGDTTLLVPGPPVPEPAMLALWLAGLAAGSLLWRRRGVNGSV